jgi:hypothetical protein
MKRYILLEGKIIIDTKDRPLFHIEENTLWHNSMLQGAILNQSDNLLDLLEVGDMVEFVDEQGLDYINLTEDYPASKVNELMLDFEITAIWKRNGDTMRRYEI